MLESYGINEDIHLKMLAMHSDYAIGRNMTFRQESRLHFD